MSVYETAAYRAAMDEIATLMDGYALRLDDAVDTLHPGEDPDNLRARVMVSPRTVGETAEIVRICRRHRVPVVTHGGRTGLVGGGISRPGELVMSLRKMNRIIEIDPVEGVAIVEAGATLQALQEAALTHGLEPGIDLAARGSATLGGMASTNAGGVMAFRNGVMRHRILGIEAVLPDGSVYADLTRVIKNSAGYDLKHLLIGAEGTLGVITRLAIRLDPQPAATATALFGLPSTAAALDLVRMARRLDELRAAEVMWERYFKLTSAHIGWSAPDYDVDSHVHLAIGLGGSDEAVLRDRLMQLFDSVLADHPQTTAVLAASSVQERQIWRLREETSLLYQTYPAAPSYDISVPMSQLADYLKRTIPALGALEPNLAPFIFGHLADGNLHIVVNRPGSWMTVARRDAIESILYDKIRSLGGSFSAEHGVGSKRIHALNATADPVKLALMATVKAALDPDRIFNPGKLFQED